MILYMRKLINKSYEILTIFGPIIGLFLPDYIFVSISIPCILLIILNIKSYRTLLSYKYNWLLVVFMSYITIIAIINKNIFGLQTNVVVLLIVIWYMNLRLKMNSKIYEIILFLIPCLSMFSIYYTKIDYQNTYSHLIVEQFNQYLNLPVSGYGEGVRLASTFFNSNYYGYVLCIIVLVCVYQLIASINSLKKMNIIKMLCVIIILYCNIKVFNLPQSRSAYGAIVAGIICLIIMNIKLKYIPLIVGGCVLLKDRFKDILISIPRINTLISSFNIRSDIQLIAINEIRTDPLWGRGFYSYLSLPKSYHVHSHNLFLECCISFGVIGSSLLIIFLIFDLYPLIDSWIKKNEQRKTLIISLLIMTAVHGVNDVVILCPQTALLFCAITSGTVIE